MFRDKKLESEVEFLQKLVGVVRSARPDYNKTKTDLYLETKDADLKWWLMIFFLTIGTLAFINRVEDVDSPHQGCASRGGQN